MEPFLYRRVPDQESALDAARQRPQSMFVAGGTDLMQLWKVNAIAPEELIDISRLPLAAIDVADDKVAIGALATLSDVARHPIIAHEYPAVTAALLSSASAQVRNVATVGGNLLQRTRCAYFRSADLPCNKRSPGTGCAAIDGENRQHAIFGASSQCVATHASDLAVALVALDAQVVTHSVEGERSIPAQEFFVEPGDDPQRETVLGAGEMIVAVALPRAEWTRRSSYLKVRDRASFEFAVVSVAVALQVDDGLVRLARVCAGGVATRPWRLHACEAALVGRPAIEQSFQAAAAIAGDGARVLAHNGFKRDLLKQTVRRALCATGDQS